MKRPRLMSALALFSAAAAWCGLAPAGDQPVPKPADESRKPIRRPVISLTASEMRSIVGDVIQLTELVPVTLKTSLRGTYHELSVLGEYDDQLKELVLLNDSRYITVGADQGKRFQGFKFTRLRVLDFPNEKPGPNRTFINEGGVKGFQRRVTPQKAGIYMLTAVWDQGDDLPALVSTPIILTVEPRPEK